jgi:hypothetical protein
VQKSDITNRFSDREFLLAVCTCFLIDFDRLEVIRDLRQLKNGGILFPVDGSTAEQKRRLPLISGWWFSVSLRRNVPFVWFRSKVMQEFHACAMVKLFSTFGGKCDP